MTLYQYEAAEPSPAILSTSANGAMVESARAFRVGPVLVTGLPGVPGSLYGGPLRGVFVDGTAGASLFDWARQEVLRPPSPTSSEPCPSDAAVEESESTARAVVELHRLTGLTWEQLAELLAVARRSLHFWASGKLLSAGHEARLRRTLAVVRRADRGSASLNRAMLLQDRGGVVPADLLAREEYDAFIELVGGGRRRREYPLAPLSAEARTARRPPPPGALVEALQDRVHVEKGRVISSRPIHRSRGK